MEKIKCKLDENHFAIDHVKQLPCGYLCCHDCIKQTLNVHFNGSFRCKACDKDHPLKSANDLLDVDMEKILSENENEIIDQLRAKLEMRMRNIEGMSYTLIEIIYRALGFFIF
jgi:hypothetical protein